ncbi:glycoside hydrolase family 32 protein [Clostridium sp. MCC353]|uniref:glycoside hydrolase family 32 protein n=1 Tax=Clostridium sp. MCC353 TaxID=2592646 RepID=UPI001C03633F|nr:glycoside hydrolase family 32 protein [Clostridium sp. MCC353]MBT9777994.1 glycoside hydrolase family 32 protein [Clostridium sp. MCC353]
MSWLNTGAYRCLELLVRAKDGEEAAEIRLKESSEESERCERVLPGYFRWLRLPVKRDTQYEIAFSGCFPGLMYLSESEDMMETGIQYLELPEDGMGELTKRGRSDGRYRERYHFTPYKNWINDPNGLCWFDGYYHMFYQYNPFSQKWGSMYWGHAVSRDLIWWKDLPIVLEPQKEILDDPTCWGGAFSGSAVLPGDGSMVFYFTRHLEGTKKWIEPEEVQMMAKSWDGIRFGEERVVIKREVFGASPNFRDPKAVLGKDGRWYLVLGSCVEEVPSVLYYRSDDMETWTYEGVLLGEMKAEGIEAIECPDIFWLDGKMVVTTSLMRYCQEPVERQHVRYYIGNWEHGRFQVETTEVLDFGGNFYAVQTFEYEGQRIAIGWAADFWKEHVEEENGSNGSMTIPRIMEIWGGTLRMRPVESVYQLKDRCIFKGNGNSLDLPEIRGNAWYARIEPERSSDFRMCLMKNGSSKLYLDYRNGELRIITDSEQVKRPDGTAFVRAVRKVEIFTDRRMTELFINDGEVSAVRIFYGGEHGSFQMDFSDRSVPVSTEVYTMASIWN